MFGISIANIFEASEGVVTGGIKSNHVLAFEEDGWNRPDLVTISAANGAIVSGSVAKETIFAQARVSKQPQP